MIGDSHSSIAGPDTNSEVSSNVPNFILGQQKKKGKTRMEAFEELNIEPVELLPSGELKLAGGKIIGHRDFKHIYRQRLKPADMREQVVINKLALEYRQMKHGALMITNGGREDTNTMMSKKTRDLMTKQ